MVVEGNISTKGLRDILSRFNNTINSNYISDVVKVYYRGSYEREKNTHKVGVLICLMIQISQ